MTVTIGVLALQGDVREHTRALEACGARVVPVRRARELDEIDGIVLPGGESTTIARLLRVFELRDPLRERLRAGLPAYGSCAGMILLADRVLDGSADQETLGGLDITVRRNAFGRQVDSFEVPLVVSGIPGSAERPLTGVFIRAPGVEAVGDGVEVLARVESDPSSPGAGRIVAVRQGRLLATSFHPEITGEVRVHRMFVDMVGASAGLLGARTREG